MKKSTFLAAFVLVLGAAAASAADASHTLHVKVLGTPQEQLRLSRELIGKMVAIPTDHQDERRAAVAAVVGHLEAVSHRWPNDSAAIAAATVLEADFLASPAVRAYPSAEQVARRGLALFVKSGTGAILYRILGLALVGSHRLAEAEQAFASAEHHPKLRELTPLDQLNVWQASAFFYDTYRHDAREAAKRCRAALHISGLESMTYMSLALRSLERSADTDKENARADLQELDRLLSESLTKNYSNPSDLATLKFYQTAAAKYHKKLG